MRQSFVFIAVFVAILILSGCGLRLGWGCNPPSCCPAGQDQACNTSKLPKVISVELTRKRIGLGESTDLVITIDKKAPAGGYSFNISSESDGTEDTFNPLLINVLSQNNTIPQNETKKTIHLQTQRVRNGAKRVMFYVGTRINPIGDTLFIDP